LPECPSLSSQDFSILRDDTPRRLSVVERVDARARHAKAEAAKPDWKKFRELSKT
jgi:hypothetical protein